MPLVRNYHPNTLADVVLTCMVNSLQAKSHDHYHPRDWFRLDQYLGTTK